MIVVWFSHYQLNRFSEISRPRNDLLRVQWTLNYSLAHSFTGQFCGIEGRGHSGIEDRTKMYDEDRFRKGFSTNTVKYLCSALSLSSSECFPDVQPKIMTLTLTTRCTHRVRTHAVLLLSVSPPSE